MKKVRGIACLIFAAAGGCIAGCGTATPPSQVTGTLEIFSPWTSGNDGQALDALVASYTGDHPTLKVVNAAMSASSNDLATRMSLNEPPGLLQDEAAPMVSKWVMVNGVDTSQSKLESLDSLFDERKWRPLYPQSVLAQVSSPDGHLYAVPLGVYRINSLFFNAKIFSQLGLFPPTTWDGFFQSAVAFKQAGMIPLAIGSTDGAPAWRALLESLVLARGGSAGYLRVWQGQDGADSPTLRGALEDLVKLTDFVNPDAQTIGWDGACDDVIAGQAAMTIAGDWAKPYFNAHGWKSEVDFSVVPAPGTAGTFITQIDVFALPIGAPNRTAAIGFLKSVGAAEGQNIFDPIKGATPPRLDALDQAQQGTYDTIAQRTISDFKNADLVPAYPVSAAFGAAFDAAIATLVNDKNVDAVMAVYTAQIGTP